MKQKARAEEEASEAYKRAADLEAGAIRMRVELDRLKAQRAAQEVNPVLQNQK